MIIEKILEKLTPKNYNEYAPYTEYFYLRNELVLTWDHKSNQKI